MSVLIKGMKMPNKCPDCPFLQEQYDILSGLLNVWCDLDSFEINDIDTDDINEIYDRIEKQKHCPLIEVPPHGRLIDADALTNFQMTGRVKASDGTNWGNQTWIVLPHYSSLSEIPTVMEADYEDDNYEER